MNTILHDTTTIACPDWCTTNHEVDPDGGHSGLSWPIIRGVSDNHAKSVSIDTALDDEHGVIVYLDAGLSGCTLTPNQAREAGLALLSAASWAKDHQVSA